MVEKVPFCQNSRLLVAPVTTSLSISYGLALENAVFGDDFVKDLAKSYAKVAVQIQLEIPF